MWAGFWQAGCLCAQLTLLHIMDHLIHVCVQCLSQSSILGSADWAPTG